MIALQFEIALDALEKKFEAKIVECNNNFQDNFRKTIKSLMQASTANTDDIVTMFKKDIAEIKNTCVLAGNDVIKPDAKVSTNKYLTVKSMSELKEEIPLQSPEIPCLVSDPSNQTLTLNEVKTEENDLTSMVKVHDNIKLDAAANETMSHDLIESYQPEVTINSRMNGNKRYYECNGCNFKSFVPWKAYRHRAVHKATNSVVDNDFKCGKCNYTAKKANLLKRHEKNVHNHSKTLQCQKCLGVFSTEYLMRKHLCSNEPLHATQPLPTFTVNQYSPINRI